MRPPEDHNVGAKYDGIRARAELDLDKGRCLPQAPVMERREIFSVQWRDDGTLKLLGELDLASEGRLEQAVAEPPSDADSLVLDLSGLTFIDSTGLQSLMNVCNMMAGRRELVLRAPQRRVLEVLRMVRVDLWPGVVIENGTKPVGGDTLGA